MNDLETYYKNSLLANLCVEYKSLWRKAGKNKEELVRLALQQQSIPHVVTFAYEGKGLTKDYLLSEFGDHINGVAHYDCDGVKGYSYRLFVDYTDKIRESTDVTSLMWCNDTEIDVPKYKCPILYVSNKSKVHINADGYNHIRVYLFDESEIFVDDSDEESVVVVYKYSDKCKVSKGKYCLGKVNEFDKTLKL